MPSEGDGHFYLGDVQIRHGMGGKVDGGLRLIRTPGALETISSLSADVKIQITNPEDKGIASFVIPVGAVWGEQGTDFEDGLLTFSPGLMLGYDISPTTERR